MSRTWTTASHCPSAATDPQISPFEDRSSRPFGSPSRTHFLPPHRHQIRLGCRAAMLRIGPTFYSHTPYARVHAGFLPLFEVPIRCLVTPPTSKVTVFCGVSRRRIAASSDGIMADKKRLMGDQIWPCREPMLPPFSAQLATCRLAQAWSSCLCSRGPSLVRSPR